MTAIDQAFIRAYEQPAAEPVREATTHMRAASDEQPDEQPWVTSVQVASPYWETAAELETTVDSIQRNQRHHRIDEKIDEKIDGQTDGQSAQAGTTKPTLSAILASRQQPKNHGESETTVDSFRLPTICRKLLTSHASAYEQVVSTLLASLDEGRTVIGLASCHSGTGCTTNLLCLASRLQAQGKSVVLVDADFANPELAGALGLSPMTTWQDVLQTGAPIAEALVRSSRDGLTLLPSELAPSDAAPNNSALNDNARLQASVTAGALRYEFDVTLVDLGFVDKESGSQSANLKLAQAMRIDATLLVVDPALDDSRQQNNAQQLLEQHGCTVLGTIENFITPQRGSAATKSGT